MTELAIVTFLAIFVVGIGAGNYQNFQNAYADVGLEHEVTSHDVEIQGAARGHSGRRLGQVGADPANRAG